MCDKAKKLLEFLLSESYSLSPWKGIPCLLKKLINHCTHNLVHNVLVSV